MTPSRRYHVRGGPAGHMIAVRADRLTGHYAERWAPLFTVTYPPHIEPDPIRLVTIGREHYTHEGA